jgi:hypothetical protein
VKTIDVQRKIAADAKHADQRQRLDQAKAWKIHRMKNGEEQTRNILTGMLIDVLAAAEAVGFDVYGALTGATDVVIPK